MVDESAVARVVRYACMIRLAAVLFVVLDPAAISTSLVGYLAILFITGTSALGLFDTARFTRWLTGHPLVIMVDIGVAALVGMAIGIQSSTIVFSTSTAVLIGILLPRRFAVPVLIVLVGSFLITAAAERDTITKTTAAMTPFSYVTICLLAALTRSLHQGALIDHARARRSSEVAAEERERARLAREMHDSVAKSLHGISMAAAALPMWAETKPDQLADRAREVQEAAEAASRDAREILTGLRAETSDQPLPQQIRALAEDLDMGGVRTNLSVDQSSALSPAVKREIVAIIGEALENIRRHSSAKKVDIDVSDDDSGLRIRITDDGVGFDPGNTPRDHFGLVGIRERAESIGATCLIDSAVGAGTRISLDLPHSAKERV